MNLFKFRCLWTVLCLPLAGYTQALQNELDPVTITATLSPAQSGKTGRNLVVIKGELFNKLPVNSVDELLRYIPGIEMQARGPMGTQSDIVIRGGTFQQVLIILDGIRLNDPLTGHFSSYIPIAPAEIDRIEVLKGASSAIYGTEAVGGVVHIVTKAFARSAKKNELNGQITAGDYGLLNAQLGGVLRDDKSTLSAGIISNHSTGQPQRGTTGYFDMTTASLGYSIKTSEKWNFALRSAYDYRSFSAQNYYTTFTSDTASEKVKTWWNHAHAGYSGTLLRWNVDVGYKKVSDNYKFNSASAANANNSNLTQVLSTIDLLPGKNTSVTAGVQYIHEGITSNDRGNHRVWQTAFFAVLHQRLGEYWTIDPAIRLDYQQVGGVEVLPQLNLSFRKNWYQLRGTVGRTLRDADFTERYNNYNRARVVSGRIGNPNLEGENGWSYEAGADAWVGKHFKVANTFFGRSQNKLIDWVNTPYDQMPRKDNLVPNGTYALATNISDVTTIGWETDLQYTRQFGAHQQLTANAGILWLKSKTPQGTEPGFYLSSHARFLTNFSVLYSYKWLQLSATGVYKTRNEQKTSAINATVSKSYYVINGRAEARLMKWLSIYLQCDNIGDVPYSDLLGCPMPGRWLMGGIKAVFDKYLYNQAD
jgi:iron complex outermembrane receptor protein